jgi:hypothetical protein
MDSVKYSQLLNNVITIEEKLHDVIKKIKEMEKTNIGLKTDNTNVTSSYTIQLSNFSSLTTESAVCTDTFYTQTKMFPCTWCGKHFKSSYGKYRHIQADHKKIRYDCQVCFRQFKRKSYVNRHMQNIHGLDKHDPFFTQQHQKMMSNNVDFHDNTDFRWFQLGKNIEIFYETIRSSMKNAPKDLKVKLSQTKQMAYDLETSIYKDKNYRFEDALKKWDHISWTFYKSIYPELFCYSD